MDGWRVTEQEIVDAVFFSYLSQKITNLTSCFVRSCSYNSHISSSTRPDKIRIHAALKREEKWTLWMFRWRYCGWVKKQLVQEMIVSRHSIVWSCAVLSVSATLMICLTLAVSSASFLLSLPNLSWSLLIHFFFHAVPHLLHPFIFNSILLIHLPPLLNTSQPLSPRCTISN